MVMNEIRAAQKVFIAELVQNSQQKQLQSIRMCVPKKSASQRTFTEDDRTVAHEFNQFFFSVGKEYRR